MKWNEISLTKLARFPDIFSSSSYLCGQLNITKKIVLILKELEKRIEFPDFFHTFIKFPDFSLISMTEIKFPDNFLISLIAGHQGLRPQLASKILLWW